MKIFLSTFTILITIAAFSACTSAKEKTDKLVENTKAGYEKTVETVNDVNTAIGKVKEAKKAIEEVTK